MYGNFFNNSGFLLITSICAESITAKEQYRHNGVKLFLEENTLPTADILSGKNACAWVSMVLYLKKYKNKRSLLNKI